VDNINNLHDRLLGGIVLGVHLKLIGIKLFKCEQCEKVRKTKQYEYQGAKFIEDYVPKMWKALCGKCTKRECGKRIFDRFTLGE
jgi:hypothetical protein